MAVINTGLLTRDARSEFLNRFSAAEKLTKYPQWAQRIGSTKATENYRWLGTVPAMREWGTGRLAKGLREESYDVTNLKYESTLEVDRDELSDDQTGQIQIRIGELAQRAAVHKDSLMADLFINGATTGFNSYDGVSFFNAAHISGASGSQDNDLAPAATTPTDVSTAEFKTAIETAIETMFAFLDDQGEPMMLNSSSLVCVVPPQLHFAALEAVNATIIANTSNVIAGIAAVEVFPYLTVGTTWYLIKTDGIVRPIIFQDREPIEFTSLTENTEEAFRREKFLYGVRARYRMTYGYWQYAIRNVFT